MKIPSAILALALGDDGSIMVALEWDYAVWTQNAANLLAQLKAVKFGKKAPAGVVIALTGDASPTVQQQAKAAGITLATRLAPGPLQ